MVGKNVDGNQSVSTHECMFVINIGYEEVVYCKFFL